MNKIKSILLMTVFTFLNVNQTRADVTYRATTIFGESVFEDIITFETMNEGAVNRGVLTVPGKFSVPIKASIERTEEDVNYGRGRYVNFIATVTENGHTSNLLYTLVSREPAMNTLRGRIYDENSSTIGQVVAVKTAQ